MTTRTDILQDYSQDPRISTVPSPSVLYIVQDVVDTIRVAEESFQAMGSLKLLNAEGKAGLGGGEVTAVTAIMQNNVIEFEARRTPAETGTITTQGLTDGRGLVQLVDTAAGFVAAGVKPGSFIINFSDLSVTDVRRVISATQLECKSLVNGTGNTFEVGDIYHLFNIIQCDVRGNVVAVDELGVEISAFLPSAFTQIVTARNSSGTIINADVATFWNALLSDHIVAGSFGEWVGRKLITVAKFLGLK